jgi:hypothetical protein
LGPDVKASQLTLESVEPALVSGIFSGRVLALEESRDGHPGAECVLDQRASNFEILSHFKTSVLN